MNTQNASVSDGKLLSMIRDYLGYDLYSVSTKTKIALSTLERLELGDRSPSDNEWQKLTQFYGLKLRGLTAYQCLEGHVANDIAIGSDPGNRLSEADRHELAKMKWFIANRSTAPSHCVVVPDYFETPDPSLFAQAVLDLTNESTFALDRGYVDVFGILSRLRVFTLIKAEVSEVGYLSLLPDASILLPRDLNAAEMRLVAARHLGRWAMSMPSVEENLSTDREWSGKAASSKPDRFTNDLLDRFVDSLLAPKHLVDHHLARWGWTPGCPLDRQLVYQLGLWLGLDYAATCKRLSQLQVILPTDVASLKQFKIAKTKRSILPIKIPDDFTGDIWRITRADQNNCLRCRTGDLIFLDLTESKGAEYDWDFEWQLHVRPRSCVSLIQDIQESRTKNAIGPWSRQFILRVDGPGNSSIDLEETRVVGSLDSYRDRFNFRIYCPDPSHTGIPIVDDIPNMARTSNARLTRQNQLLQSLVADCAPFAFGP